MPAQNFSITQAINYGWQMTKANLLRVIAVVTFVISIQFLTSFIITLINPDPGLISTGLRLIRTLINTTLTIGLIKFFLTLTLKQTANLTDLFSGLTLKTFINYCLGSILYSILTILGLIFFIIPGFIIAIGYGFYAFFIIDQNVNPFRAFKDSWQITKNHKAKLLIYTLCLFLLNLLGFLTLGIGLLITLPISITSLTYLYRTLSQAESN